MDYYYHIAVDLGASSGRVVVAHLENDIIVSHEIHRFDNCIKQSEGYLVWDIDDLINQILKGLAMATAKGVTRATLAIDSWAVDYLLLDQAGKPMAPLYCYRDNRCHAGFNAITDQFSPQQLFDMSGIAPLPFNSLFQLASPAQVVPTDAASIMLIPDYIMFYLTGIKVSEKSNSSTTGMLNYRTQIFDEALLNALSLNSQCFAPLTEATTMLGRVKSAIELEHGLPILEVVVAATHDTASAVLGSPYAGTKGYAFLSSGTWSLLGCEVAEPIVSDLAYKSGYSNEWGGLGGYRFLRNIMGLWLIQELKRMIGNQYSFAELAALAEKEKAFVYLFDVNSEELTKPDNMIATIEKLCQAPLGSMTIAQVARAIYDSLALAYRHAVGQLQQLVGYPITHLNIIGGGSKNGFFNQHIANVTGLVVVAGPSEATVMGNIATQLLACQKVSSIKQARNIIKNSNNLLYYYPGKNNGSSHDNQQYVNTKGEQ